MVLEKITRINVCSDKIISIKMFNLNGCNIPFSFDKQLNHYQSIKFATLKVYLSEHKNCGWMRNFQQNIYQQILAIKNIVLLIFFFHIENFLNNMYKFTGLHISFLYYYNIYKND